MSGEPGPGEAVSVALAECDMHLNNLEVRQRNSFAASAGETYF